MRARTRWAAPLSFILGIGAVLLGGLLIEKHAHSNAGSISGWILLAAGIFLGLTALAIVFGAYDE